ncbi:MAG: hypothetical protein K2X87_12860, partial [Gemmataceae bacterium]|nr:hypothetical protein [Gemmataceae bacterium]
METVYLHDDPSDPDPPVRVLVVARPGDARDRLRELAADAGAEVGVADDHRAAADLLAGGAFRACL